jgi:hypothetical protein
LELVEEDVAVGLSDSSERVGVVLEDAESQRHHVVERDLLVRDAGVAIDPVIRVQSVLSR